MTLGPQGHAHSAFAAAKDPVCGMDVVPGEAAGGSAQHARTTYWFCNPGCREKFLVDPARYTGACPLHRSFPRCSRARGESTRARCTRRSARPDPEPAPSAAWRSSRASSAARGRQSTSARCTRRSSGASPGRCPICGMALEPRTVTATEEDNPELADMTRRFWVGLVLTVPALRAGDVATCIPGQPRPARGVPAASSPGSSSCSRRRSCSGAAGRSSSAAGHRSRTAARTCSR